MYKSLSLSLSLSLARSRALSLSAPPFAPASVPTPCCDRVEDVDSGAHSPIRVHGGSDHAAPALTPSWCRVWSSLSNALFASKGFLDKQPFKMLL